MTLVFFSLILPARGQPRVVQVASLDTELKASLSFVQDMIDKKVIQQEEAPCIRLFTSYSLPEELQESALPALSVVLNHCAFYDGPGVIYVPKRVPGSTTLFWIDIREYGWSEKQLEDVSNLDPYLAEPLVDHRLYNFGRLIAGNILFRIDWFIVNAMDTSKQIDPGLAVANKQNQDIIYYILLYGKGNEPKDEDDFNKFWRIDVKTAKKIFIDKATVVNKGDSGVSRHTRQAKRLRTIFGYDWKTNDVKSHAAIKVKDGKFEPRDYVEDIFAENADAHEYIATQKNGMQVYLLTDQDEKRLDIADTTIVVDRTDPEDVRVRTAISCMRCHEQGINACTNAIKAMILRGVDLRARSQYQKFKIDSLYLDDLNSLIEDDCQIFQRAMRKATGFRNPKQGVDAVMAIYDFYVYRDVTMEQAAVEMGFANVAVMKAALRPNASGRLSWFYYGQAIPRDVWDSLYGGAYAQAMLVAKRIKPEEALRPAVRKRVILPLFRIRLLARTSVQDDDGQKLVYKDVGTVLGVEKTDSQKGEKWYRVTTDGKTGWVWGGNTEVIGVNEKIP